MSADGMSWVECKGAFFQQGDEYTLDSGWMSLDDAKAKVLEQPDKALGICVQDGDLDNCYCCIVPIGTPKYSGEGWTCYIYKTELPDADECFTDEYSEHLDSNGYDLQRPGRGEGLGDGIRTLSLFSGIDPNDMDQGALGDCWLISAFAAMAEFPDALMGLFDKTTLAPDGHYAITLYSYAEGDFKTIEIDDRFPVGNSGNCAYVKLTEEGEIWPCLLEKAFAAYSDGYDNLSGGQSIFAFGAMTGCTDLAMYSRQDDGSWQESNPSWSTDQVHEAEWGYVESTPSDEEVFAMIADADANDYLMCAGSHHGSDSDTDASGVVQGHAYTLLCVKENVCGSGINLLQLRNPWGKGEWTGDWSDESDLWDAHPDIKEECGHEIAVDGLFWMTWEDFTEHYSTIYLCKKSMGASRGKKTQLATQEMAEASEDIPKAPEKVNRSLELKQKPPSMFASILKMFGCSQ